MTPSVIAGRFQIEREAGAGGAGQVFRALDRETGAPVAVKLLSVRDPAGTERFTREARLLEAVRHPGIVRFIDHGATDDGRPYLVMEWLEGEDLGQRLARESLDLSESILATRHIAEALGAAHRAGVVHRDVKPSNVFLVDGEIDRIKILDFGIARTTSGASALTLTGSIVGTPGYMAPEQARGSPDIDCRADVFALGCVLFRCLTGRRPFEGDDPLALLMKVATESPPRASELRPDLPVALDDLVAAMLQRLPDDRPADANQVAEELLRLGPLVGGPPRPGVTPPAGITTTERRMISLVVGHVPSRRSQPTIVADTVRRREETLRRQAERAGGQLELSTHGAVLITLSALESAHELAIRAARCALAIRPLADDIPLAVVTGRGSARTGSPVHGLIDRALALLDDHDGDAIRLDDVTRGLLDARFEVRDADAGYELVGERDVEATRIFLGRPTLCVGRDRELSNLVGLYEEARDEEVARVALVTAAAGIGKSRIRYELLRRIQEEDLRSDEPEPQIWLGRGDPMSRNVPFGVLGQIVRRAAGVAAGEDADAAAAKVRHRVERVAASRDVGRLVEFLCALAGIDADVPPSVQLAAARNDAVLMGDQMRLAWTDWVTAECAQHPVIMVLEDLHWADRPSVDLVDALLRAAEESPLFVLALGRPEVHERFPRLWPGRAVQELRLGELTKKASEKLARSVLGSEVSEELVMTVVERAAGNAFYLEELLRAVSHGRASELPETILAMAESRLDDLGPEARRVLRAASILGRDFRPETVAALLGDGKEAAVAEQWLGALTDQEVLSARADRLGAPKLYTFRHALLREAAYASLTAEDAELGHRLAAEFLEASHEVDPGVVAEHFERGNLPERAAEWHLRAAEQSLSGDDFVAAVEHAERGIRASPDPRVRARLHLRAAAARRWLQANAEAQASALAALELMETYTAGWFAALGEAALASSKRGDPAKLVELADAADRAPRTIEGVEPVIGGLARLAFALLAAGQPGKSISIISRIGDLEARGLDGPAARARAEQARALAAVHQGDIAAYIELSEAAVRSFEEAGDLRAATTQRVNVGFSLTRVGAWERAVESLEKTRADAERMGLSLVVLSTLASSGLALAHLGELDEGRRRLESALISAAAAGPRAHASTETYLATVIAMAGDHVTAAKHARAAVERSAATPPARVAALATLGDILLRSGRPDEARQPAREACDLIDELGGVDEGTALARLVLAEAEISAGDEAAGDRSLELAARELLDRASRLEDETLRRQMLERVPEHRRTLALWAARSGESIHLRSSS